LLLYPSRVSIVGSKDIDLTMPLYAQV
jgi:hypothetical protein